MKCSGCKCDDSKSESCKGDCDDDCGGDCKKDSCAYAEAHALALKQNGMTCLVCKNFDTFVTPNRTDGTYVCWVCKTTRAWKVPPGTWR